MALKLGLLEGLCLVAAVYGAILPDAYPLRQNWIEALILLGKAFTVPLCCAAAFYYNDLYDLRVVSSFGPFARRLLQASAVAFTALSLLYWLVPEVNISTETLDRCFLIILPVLLGLRALFYGLMRQRLFRERVLIVGTSPLARQIIREIEARPDLRCTIVGVADTTSAAHGASFAYPLLGPLERLDKIIDDLQPDRVIVALAERRAQLPVHQLLQARMQGRVVEEGVAAFERFTGKLAIESLTPSSLLFSSDFKQSPLDLAGRRFVSIIVSVVGLVALAPLIGVIALLIKLDSRGPVFFVQERIGMSGKRFKLAKFRTMASADICRSEWVCDNTERITRVGKWLRRFRLDEFPQFLNVIRGDMNFVGPRPHPVSNFELFAEKIPYYWLRSVVRPGITGWAQVRFGYANNLDEETEKMRYDLYYIKHLSLWFDLRILVDTVKTVIFSPRSPSPDVNEPKAAMAASGR